MIDVFCNTDMMLKTNSSIHFQGDHLFGKPERLKGWKIISGSFKKSRNVSK